MPDEIEIDLDASDRAFDKAAARRRAAREPTRLEGPTPNGGAYAIAYTHDDGSVEIVECDDKDEAIFRTYGKPAAVTTRTAGAEPGGEQSPNGGPA